MSVLATAAMQVLFATFIKMSCLVLSLLSLKCLVLSCHKNTHTNKQYPLYDALPPDPSILDPDRMVKIINDLVDNGSKSGPLGGSGCHLAALVEPSARRHFPHLHKNLAVFLSYIIRGFFENDVKHLLLASDLIGIPKKSGDSEDVRPIAMGEVLYKTAAHCCLDLLGDKIKKIFPKIQYGVGTTGGSQAAIHVIRTAFTVIPNVSPADRDAILDRRIALAIDFKNAFNALFRHVMMEKLLDDDRTRPLWNFIYWSYAESSPLLVFDNQTNVLAALLHSEQGVRQGDPIAAFAFAFTVQQLYREALKVSAEVEGVAVLDDLTLVGDYEQVLKVFDKLLSLSPSYGLHLQQHKCQVLMPRGYCPGNNAAKYQHIADACQSRNLPVSNHIQILGIKLGNGTILADDECRNHVTSVVKSHRNLFRLLSHPVMPPQIGALLLRMCMVPRMMYFARTVPPQHVHLAALEFDRMVLECFSDIVDLKTSMAPLTAKEHAIISTPIANGGVGLKQSVQTIHAAYLASLVPILPQLRKMFPASRFCLSESSVAQDIEACLSELAIQGITDAQLLSMGVDTGGVNRERLWSGSTGSVRGRAVSLQKAFTKRIEGKLMEVFLNSLPPDDPTRILLLSSSGRAASLWLTCVPIERSHQMTDIEFQYAMRRRLGRLPSDQLINQICCCGAVLKDQPHTHFLDCRLLCDLRTKCHDGVRDAVASFATECSRGSMGFIVVEPSCRDYADSSKPNSRERADIVIVNNVTSTMVDVTVIDPCSKSSARVPGIYQTPMVSVSRAVTSKIAHHYGRAAEKKLKLCIFAAETMGAINPAGIRLLTQIARSADLDAGQSEVASLYYQGATRVSVALQKGLSKISERGCGLTSISRAAG